MAAGDPSQTTPEQIACYLLLCCSTQIGQYIVKTCIICTGVVWLLSPVVMEP